MPGLDANNEMRTQFMFSRTHGRTILDENYKPKTLVNLQFGLWNLW